MRADDGQRWQFLWRNRVESHYLEFLKLPSGLNINMPPWHFAPPSPSFTMETDDRIQDLMSGLPGERQKIRLAEITEGV